MNGVDASSPLIDLSQPGRTEIEWRAVLDGLPPISFPDARGRRVVVVSPHPDDESLGVGGTVALLADAGAAVQVICLTAGEAAPCAIGDLAKIRRAEVAAAVRILAPQGTLTLCGFADGCLAECAGDLIVRLTDLLQPGDLVFATLDGDGHPDHDATGAAARVAASACGAELWWYPVWASHWHDPTTSTLSTRGRRSVLTDAAMRRKRAAVACHRSQLLGTDAVVPPAHLPRFRRPFEVLVRA